MNDLEKIANDPELLEIGRLAVENALIQCRDLRVFQIRNNGLVIKKSRIRWYSPYR